MMEVLIKIAPLLSVFVASVSFGLSALSFRNARRALRISEEQEERKKPLIVTYLENGYRRSSAKFDLFAFLITVNSQSDSNGSIARVELQITYTIASGQRLTLQIPSDAAAIDAAATAEIPALKNSIAIPFRIDSRQSLAGWCVFKVQRVLLAEAQRIVGYKLVFFDNFGNQTALEPQVISEAEHAILP